MTLEAIKAAETLLHNNLITEQQFAELVIKSLNGHVNAAVQPQLPLIKKSGKRNMLNLEQTQAIVEMHLMGQPHQVIADTVNQRYQLRLSKCGVANVIRDIAIGRKVKYERYQTPEWQAALIGWQRAINA